MGKKKKKLCYYTTRASGQRNITSTGSSWAHASPSDLTPTQPPSPTPAPSHPQTSGLRLDSHTAATTYFSSSCQRSMTHCLASSARAMRCLFSTCRATLAFRASASWERKLTSSAASIACRQTMAGPRS